MMPGFVVLLPIPFFARRDDFVCGAGCQPAADWQSACPGRPQSLRTDGCPSAACRYLGRQSCLAAAFQAALSEQARVFLPEARRLKAGGSQDWLPHNFEALT